MRIWSEQKGLPSKVFVRDPSSSLMSLIFYQNSKVFGQPSGASTTYRYDMYNIYMMIQQEDRAHIIFSLVISHHAWFFHLLSSLPANILSTWTLKLLFKKKKMNPKALPISLCMWLPTSLVGYTSFSEIYSTVDPILTFIG